MIKINFKDQEVQRLVNKKDQTPLKSIQLHSKNQLMNGLYSRVPVWTGMLKRNIIESTNIDNYKSSTKVLIVKWPFLSSVEEGRDEVIHKTAKTLRWWLDPQKTTPIFRRRAGPARGSWFIRDSLKELESKIKGIVDYGIKIWLKF